MLETRQHTQQADSTHRNIHQLTMQREKWYNNLGMHKLGIHTYNVLVSKQVLCVNVKKETLTQTTCFDTKTFCV